MQDTKQTSGSPGHARFNMELPESLLDGLRQTAAANDRSMSAEARRIIESHVARERGETGAAR